MEDLEKAEAPAAFAETTGVFDKAPSDDTTPPANKASPQIPEPSILQANQDKLVVDVVAVKANQEEINKKLDSVLQLEKKVDLLLQNLKKMEQGKNKNDFDITASNEFLNSIAYQSTIECTPPSSNDGSVMMLELSPGIHVVPPLEVENVQFKRRNLGNVGWKEYKNPSGK